MILKANITNLQDITNLALKLWPEHDFNDLIREYQDIVLNENNAIFIYYINDKSKKLFCNGVQCFTGANEGTYRVYDKDGQFLSVAQVIKKDETKVLKSIKTFY